MTNDSPTTQPGWEYITELAGALAHEIKNPLGTISLNLQLLEEDCPDPQTPRERRTCRKLKILRKEVQRLRQTLEDFLRFVKAERLDLSLTDINELLAEVGEFVEPELNRVKIELREQYTQGLPNCPVDRKLLKQAILNLILNAQQAMPDGGELILRTSQAHGAVDVEVIDAGDGIPPGLQDKIFDPFYSTKTGGSGLGLPMTKRIIEQHGGRITFHSDPMKGTDFAISIPTTAEPTGSEDR